MKKLILISVLLFSFNGWADESGSGVIGRSDLQTKLTEANKIYKKGRGDKAMAMGKLSFSLSYGFCTNQPNIDEAMKCALEMCKLGKYRCKVVAKNNGASEKIIREIFAELGWIAQKPNNQPRTTNNQSSQKPNNQPRTTNNQSEQMQIIELCLQSQAQARERYTCSPHLTKQGGLGGFVEQVNACRSEKQRMYPDSVCFGAPQPRYEAPQQNNSVQLCNFECWGGQIVQGDCNDSSVTVNGRACWKR